MPFTPFHLGPSLAVGVSAKRIFHIPAFIAGSVLLDIEPLLILLLHLDCPLHGFFHTLLGGFLASIPISVLFFALRKHVGRIFSLLKLEQSQSLSFIFPGSFSGTATHVLVDSIFHSEIHPFFPLSFNPFYRLLTSGEIHVICLVSFILAGAVYGIRLAAENKKRKEDNQVIKS